MAGASGKKTCDGFALKREADRIEGAATIRLLAARRRLERATRSTILRMESLRRDQEAIREQIVEELAPTMARVTRVEDGGWKVLEAAAFDPDRLAVAWQVGPAATPELFKDTMVGIAAGMALRQGAFAAARGFGVASTGIAIGELGGAAAPEEKADRYLECGMQMTMDVGREINAGTRWNKEAVQERAARIEAFVREEWGG